MPKEGNIVRRLDKGKVGHGSLPPIRSEANALAGEVQYMQDQWQPPSQLESDNADVNANGQRRSNEFPVRTAQASPYDTRMEIKRQLIGSSDTGATPYGIATITEQDYKNMEEKVAQAQRLEYETFLANYFNITSPAEAAYVQKIMPEFLDRREQEIDAQAKLQGNLAKLRLRGPQNKEDLLLVWMLKTGQVPLPKKPLWDPDWYDSASNAKENFVRGVFSPRRYFGGVIGKKATRYDPLRSDNAAISKVGLLGGAKSNDSYRELFKTIMPNNM
jgi:hypothetical protein